MLEIIEIKSADKKYFKKFVDFPNELYRGCPYYIPYTYGDEINLLNPKKNAAFEQCKAKYFLALRDGKVVGRIAGLIQLKYNELSGEKRMRFTRFDFVNDLEVVQKLLEKVEEFAREEGMDIVHGPFGFYDMDREGMRVDGFDRKATLATNYNYDYYYPLIRQCGYEDECLWHEYLITVPDKVPDKVRRIAEIARKRYHLSLVKEKNIGTLIKKYQDQIFDLYDRAYSVLHGAVPLTQRLRDQIAGQFRSIINLDFFPLVVNEQGDVVGLGLAFTNLCECFRKSGGKLTLPAIFGILNEKKHPTGSELAIVGVADEYRAKGAMAIIMEDMIEAFLKYGIRQVETNPELVTNHQIQSLWGDFEKEQHKKAKSVIKYLQ